MNNVLQLELAFDGQEHKSLLPASDDTAAVREKNGYKSGNSTKDKDNGVTYMERLLNEQGHLTFMGSKLTGAVKIESSNDVAFLFKNLESAATENVFAVMIKEDKSYSVLYLGTGTPRSVPVDESLIAAAARELDSRGVILVHNHPSGNLEHSSDDVNLHLKLSRMLEGSGVELMPSVIINTDSGKYAVFTDYSKDFSIHERPQTSQELIEAKIYQFDRQKLYVPSTQRPTISTPKDAALFLSRQKRGTNGKIHAMMIDNQNTITRYSLYDSAMNEKELSAQLIADAGKYGNHMILSCNEPVSLDYLTNVKEELKSASVGLIDVIGVRQDKEIMDSYRSFRTETDMKFSEPAVAYGAANDVLQLDMFSDYIDVKDKPVNGGYDDSYIYSETGKVDAIGTQAPRSSGKVLPELLQTATGSGNAQRDDRTSGEDRDRTGNPVGGNGDAAARSAGDSVSPVHLPHPGNAGNRGDLDYRVTESDMIGSGGKAAKFEANAAAIQLLKNLEKENRSATAGEQAVLVKYTGWGGLSEALRPDGDSRDDAWTRRSAELKQLLTPEEHQSVCASTLNAYYTSPDIVNAVWNGVKRMGYTGGPTLEPAAGTGLFLGGRPKELPVQMHGVELDSISGRIARQLYQSADIRIGGYEDYKIPENRFNLAISNVPFGNYQVYENRANKTPGVDNGHTIHDYYFLKSLHGVKEGGLVAFITSTGTLDKTNNEIRSQIAKNADFVGAIRLPNNAFKQMADTEVVSDIVFLQKRSPGKEMSQLTKEFINTSPITLKDADGKDQEVDINSYFVSHPEMVLGTADLSGTMYRGNEYTVNLDHGELASRLDAAINTLPENIMSIAAQDKAAEMDKALGTTFSRRNHYEMPVDSFVIGSDNRVYYKTLQDTNGAMFELHKAYNEDKTLNKDGANTIARIKGMIEIRDCTRDIFANQYTDISGSEVKENRSAELSARLNTLYDNFVRQYGELNSSKNRAAFHEDPDSSLVTALEVKDKETKKYHKADIFTGVNFAVNKLPDRVDSAIDAMSLSLTQHGSIDVGYMSSLTGMSHDDLIRELVESKRMYLDHQNFLNGVEKYIPADEYLSGNIREKLRSVEALLDKSPQFIRNFGDLKAVMPPDLGPEEIRVKINSPIVGEKHVRDFIKEQWSLNDDDLKTNYIPVTGEWDVHINCFSSKTTKADRQTYGYVGKLLSDRGEGAAYVNIYGRKILKKMLNNKPLTTEIKYESSNHENKKIMVLDRKASEVATAIAYDKAEAIEQAFQKWIWKDPERTNDIVSRYNETFNCIVPRKFTHPERMSDPDAKIRLHGCAFHSPLRPHQADAVWRGIQQQNTMLAHAVGAGKTLEIICTAMEKRRLGLCKKPLIVCPDHLIGQWRDEFRNAYPAAKLLIADDVNWSKENREAFINRIATGDWDSVLLRKTAFGKIPISPEKETEYLNNRLAEYRNYLDLVSDDNNWTRKAIEKKIKSYETKIEELADSKKDNVLYFEQLGVDHLFVDEADLFKNLEYTTQLVNVKGLGTPMGSQRAFDMYMKVQHIQENEGAITFATGTPISNSLVEGYTHMRYLQPKELERCDVASFDQWSRMFAEAVTTMELDNTGKSFKSATRLSKVVNVPELMSILRQAWDIKTPKDLERMGILVPGKNLPYKKVINVVAPPTPLLTSYRDDLVRREAQIKGKRSEKGGDNVLTIRMDGSKAAVDLRLIDPSLPDDPNSKLNKVVDIITDVVKRYDKERYTVAVFIDRPCSHDDIDEILFNAVEDMKCKLIERGVVKPHEVEWASDRQYREGNKKDEKRLELQAKVNDGVVRVVFGSTETMGAGTNFQRKLKAIIHADVPHRPRDMEQQEGRGYRPGNEVGELEIYNVATKGSLDTGMYNVLEIKQKSFQQIMEGDSTIRVFEEDPYCSIKELSIENEFIREKLELEQRLKRLESLRYSYDMSIAAAHRDISAHPERMGSAVNSLEAIKQDISKRAPEESVKAEMFSIVLDGTRYDKRKDAGNAIIEAAQKGWKTQGLVRKDIGSFAGCNLQLTTECHPLDSMGMTLSYSASIKIKDINNSLSLPVSSIDDPVGLCVKLHNLIYSKMDTDLQAAQQRIDSLNQNYENNAAYVNTKFEKQGELDSVNKRLSVVNNILREQQKNDTTVKRHDSFPWDKLDKMTPEQIRTAARNYCAKENYSFDWPQEEHTVTQPQPAAPSDTPSQTQPVVDQPPVTEISSGKQAAAYIKSIEGLTLNAGVAAYFDNRLEDKHLSPGEIPAVLDNAYSTYKENNTFEWNDNGSGRVEYRGGDNLQKGDFVVENRDKMFDLFVVKDDKGTLSKLGRNEDFEVIQIDVESRVMSRMVGAAVNDYVKEKVLDKRDGPRQPVVAKIYSLTD